MRNSWNRASKAFKATNFWPFSCAPATKGINVNQVAKRLLKARPPEKLLDISLEELKSFKGIGPDKAVTVIAALELGKRALNQFDNSVPVIDTPQKAVDQLTLIRSKSKEHFVCLYLNARHQLIHQETVSIGTLDASLVHPREVFKPAIDHSAAAIILAHNHPSGSLDKSPQDLQITQRLITAGDLLGIKIIDHLILTKKSWTSFKESGWM